MIFFAIAIFLSSTDMPLQGRVGAMLMEGVKDGNLLRLGEMEGAPEGAVDRMVEGDSEGVGGGASDGAVDEPAEGDIDGALDATTDGVDVGTSILGSSPSGGAGEKGLSPGEIVGP